MASITFSTYANNNIGSGLNGSGLGFYGSGGFGTSVPLLSYQGSTFVTSSDGTIQGPAAFNVAYIAPSACQITAGSTGTGLLSKSNSVNATLVVHFDHTAAVKVQNAQLRIYDRDNIDNPATGVITKVAEIVNFNGATYDYWNGTNAGSTFTTATGSGDAFWWGAPWPKTHCNIEVSADSTNATRPYYQNSVGVKFYNFTLEQITAGSGNLDQRVSGLAYPGYETVGGTGIIVPLLDSPGSGGRLLASGTSSSVPLPKYAQYINETSQTSASGPVGAATSYASGTQIGRMFGGSGADLRHTWRLALSAAPLSIGSKTQFGMYVSLEYL